MSFKKSVLTMATVSALALSPAAMAANDWQGQAKDAWLDGKLETALMLNDELNSFDIDSDVDHGVVTLSGEVENSTEKELAAQIASNVEGVADVHNNLKVDQKAKKDSDMAKAGKSFSRGWHDMTITAGLKMEYAANDDISATDIDIDTDNGVVTLDGTVNSDAAHDLAVEMAKGYSHVVEVQDHLKVQ